MGRLLRTATGSTMCMTRQLTAEIMAVQSNKSSDSGNLLYPIQQNDRVCHYYQGW